MTQYEPTLRFSQDSIGETYHIWDERLGEWVKGTLTELGTDTICFQWEDMQYDTEYQIFDLPLIVSHLDPKQLEEISPLRSVWKLLINRVVDLQIESILNTETTSLSTEYMITKLMQEFKIEKL